MVPGRPWAEVVLLVALVGMVAACAGSSSGPVNLRLQVSMTAEELADFRPALEAVDQARSDFTVVLEEVPQRSEAEKITTQLAAGELPDVLRVQGLNVQQWIRRNAFADLGNRIAAGGLDLSDFYPGPVDQYRFAGKIWGVPDTASPEVVYYDRDAFEQAGIDPIDDSWTYDDMRDAALALTVDSNGRHPLDNGFDPAAIEQWGWNGGITYFWQNSFVKARGGDLCANEDCTLMSFTSAANRAALDWWISLVRDDHVALHDPYGGSQTGVQGDPFLAGAAAMGTNGSFAIGQLNASGSINYDIAPPLRGVDGQRYTPLSTQGFVISANTTHPNEAWALLQELVSTDFLSQTWGQTGNGVPARRSAAASVVDLSHPPLNQQAIVTAMESGEVFEPSTAHAFDAYGATADIFRRLNTGELDLDQGLAELERVANEALAEDRSP